jgi:hypothetical protein
MLMLIIVIFTSCKDKDSNVNITTEKQTFIDSTSLVENSVVITDNSNPDEMSDNHLTLQESIASIILTNYPNGVYLNKYKLYVMEQSINRDSLINTLYAYISINDHVGEDLFEAFKNDIPETVLCEMYGNAEYDQNSIKAELIRQGFIKGK